VRLADAAVWCVIAVLFGLTAALVYMNER